MQINFKYKSSKYVIRKGDFLAQISSLYSKKYYLQNIDMGAYTANIFVSDKNISNIEYVGSDLIYYRIKYKNGNLTTITKEQLLNNTDFIEAKIIDGDLIVLKMPHYDYLDVISGYSLITQSKTVNISLPEDVDVLIEKLEKIFRKEIISVMDTTTYDVKEGVYNGDIEYRFNGYRFKTNDKLIYQSGGYKFAYIPENKFVLIIKE